MNDFTPLFHPKSVAIIGAGKNPVGGIKYYRALKISGYIKNGGKVYLINPKFTELLDQPVFPTIQDERLPKPIDLAIIAVKARLVPDALAQCHNYAKFAVIYTSGFGEAGNMELDKKLKETIAAVDTQIIGPNCIGIINTTSKLTVFPGWNFKKGGLSYIAQSGGTMARLYLMGISMGIGFNSSVAIGNAYGIQPLDLMKYFVEDEEHPTNVIALYLETIQNGRAFMDFAKKTTPHTPVVLFKGGQTNQTMDATFSHTGGLGGSYEIWKAMCKQTGILLADNFELFMDLVQVASIRPIPPKNLNVCILVAGGGIGVEFADNFIRSGLDLAEISQKTKDKLAQIFPAVNTSFTNPIDLGEYGYIPEYFAKAMEIVLQEENIGSIVFVREPERFPFISKNFGLKDSQKETIKSLSALLKNTNIPVFCNPSANEDSEESYHLRKDFQDKMIAAKIPIINNFRNIPTIIQQFYIYGKFIKYMY